MSRKNGEIEPSETWIVSRHLPRSPFDTLGGSFELLDGLMPVSGETQPPAILTGILGTKKLEKLTQPKIFVSWFFCNQTLSR